MDKPKILIIDDERRFVSSLKKLLNLDFEVRTAPNGKKGFQLFEKCLPSLILLDLDMPVMNGLEVLDKIRKIDRDVLIIIMTGRNSHRMARHCADLGVDGYIEKPFDLSALMRKMNSLLGIGDCQVLLDLWGDDYEKRISHAGPLVRKVLEIIWQDEGKNFSRSQAAKTLQVSPEHLSRIFHEKCGIPMSEYLNRYRVRKSFPYLIGKRHLKIKDVAAAIGVNDANYFCRFFKKTMGITPTEFREREAL
ncbi:MAG: response regulator [Deltaproteobacteria bacterium]|nr:response regulator [Deltaproteobacteria bacterium]